MVLDSRHDVSEDKPTTCQVPETLIHPCTQHSALSHWIIEKVSMQADIPVHWQRQETDEQKKVADAAAQAVSRQLFKTKPHLWKLSTINLSIMLRIGEESSSPSSKGWKLIGSSRKLVKSCIKISCLHLQELYVILKGLWVIPALFPGVNTVSAFTAHRFLHSPQLLKHSAPLSL